MRRNLCRDITEAIGHTPLIRLSRLAGDLPERVAVKHEGFNPFGSIKDRIGLVMMVLWVIGSGVQVVWNKQGFEEHLRSHAHAQG